MKPSTEIKTGVNTGFTPDGLMFKPGVLLF